MTETINIRARVIAINANYVLFSSEVEDWAFSLYARKDLTEQLVSYRFERIDIEAAVTRDKEGHIMFGTLTGWYSLSLGDTISIWREYADQNLSHWGIEEVREA